MYDKIEVSFEDNTTTIIFVTEDDDTQDVLAGLQDSTGLDVIGYSILDTITIDAEDYA